MRLVTRAFLPALAAAVAAGCAAPRFATGPAEEWVEVGAFRLDLETRSVIATGFVNQARGPVELFACGPGGKRHESILVLYGDLVDLQTALLLLGVKGGEPMKGLGDGPPRGSPVGLLVEWEQDGRGRQVDAGSWLLDTKSGRAPEKTGWVFTGSMFEDGKFMALAEHSIVATYWDPWALINIAAPCGDDDERVCANPSAVPPIDTPVRLIITTR